MALQAQIGGGSARDLDEWMLSMLVMARPLRFMWDIGPGRGDRGRIIHEAYPELKLIGSEINPQYQAPPWYHEYRHEDVLQLASRKLIVDPAYDVVMIADVLEHFLKGDALSLVDWALYQARWVMLFWPTNYIKSSKDPIEERHVCQPRLHDFTGMDLRSYIRTEAAGGFECCGALIKGVR
jgi:hypothetical protein